MRSYVIPTLDCDLNPELFIHAREAMVNFASVKTLPIQLQALWLIDRASSFIKLPHFHPRKQAATVWIQSNTCFAL